MPKTLDEGFNTFLKWLSPLPGENSKATSHKLSVRSCLEKNFACYDFLETGSFGNGTGIRHFSDTDFFAAIPSDFLSSNSSYVLGKVRDALKSTFWSTVGIAVNTPSVKIPFGTYASETLEVTPARFISLISSPLGQKGYYEIPDYFGSWMKSSPAAHNSYVKSQDQRLQNRLKPLIKLAKAWKYYNDAPINSFYLELRVTKYAESQKSIAFDIDLRNIIKMLVDNNLASIQDPMSISGYVSPCSTETQKEAALAKLSGDLPRAIKAVDNRLSNTDEAFRLWNLFFNHKFPAR